jgi:hypothetical protein
MDLSFTRRRKGKPIEGTPDLQSLLSAAAARQSSSPTARAATATDDESRIVSHDDPRIGMFAAERQQPGTVSCSASFSEVPAKQFNRGQR